MNKAPAVGVAVLIQHDNRVVIGRRGKPPMAGSWQLPGGWLRYGERPAEAVARFVAGFPGMRGGAPVFAAITDNHFSDGLHSVSLYYRLHCQNPAQVELQRNPACSDWRWADWYDLPDDLFLPLGELKNSGFCPQCPPS